MSLLVIVCGLPGSGKTTHAKVLEARLPAVRFCPDEWMSELRIDLYDDMSRAGIEALQWTIGQRLLELGQSIIIEWGTWGRSERDALRVGARGIGAKVELHFLSAPIGVLFERIQARCTESPSIEWDDLVRWEAQFEEPTTEESALYDNFLDLMHC